MEVTGLTDSQTGLFNRIGFRLHAEEVLRQAQEQERYIVVAHADMDYLNRINSQFGHEEGDAAIRGVVAILQELKGQRMVVGRLSGDGFGIAFDTDDPEDAERLREQLEAVTEQYNRESGKQYNVRLSMGVSACFCTGELRLEDLLRQADDDLYLQKKKKKSFIG